MKRTTESCEWGFRNGVVGVYVHDHTTDRDTPQAARDRAQAAFDELDELDELDDEEMPERQKQDLALRAWNVAYAARDRAQAAFDARDKARAAFDAAVADEAGAAMIARAAVAWARSVEAYEQAEQVGRDAWAKLNTAALGLRK